MIEFWWVQTLVRVAILSAQVQLRPERPEGVWPVSISGWVALVSGTVALVTVLWRANNKPVLDRLQTIENKLATEVNRIEGLLENAEQQRIDADQRTTRDLERTLVEFRTLVDHKINGFGGRVDENKARTQELEASFREDLAFLSTQQVGLSERMLVTIEGNRSFAGTASNNGIAVDIGPVTRKDILGYFHPRTA